jgi:hypothetical protein
MREPPNNAKAAWQGGSAVTTATVDLSPETLRNTSHKRPHKGYFRTSEEALRTIERSFEEPWAIRAAKAAYTAFCRKVNLRGSETFEDTIGSLAQDMSYPYREAQRAVGLLEKIGLVHVRRRKIPGTKANAPSIYSVNTMPGAGTTLQRQDRTLGREAGTLGEDELRGTSPQHSQELPQQLDPNTSLSAPRQARPHREREKDIWSETIARLATKYSISHEEVEKAWTNHAADMSKLKSRAYPTPETLERALPSILMRSASKDQGAAKSSNRAQQRAVGLRARWWREWQQAGGLSETNSWDSASANARKAFMGSKWGDYFRGQAEGLGDQISVDDFGAIGAPSNN